jgi:hypothetical protein
LNFDLALSAAIASLGVGDSIGIVASPEELPKQKALNLYYLHRNVKAADPEDWVLRTKALSTNWRDGWERLVAAKVLLTPIVVFVGLGSPADVSWKAPRRSGRQYQRETRRTKQIQETAINRNSSER